MFPLCFVQRGNENKNKNSKDETWREVKQYQRRWEAELKVPLEAYSWSVSCPVRYLKQIIWPECDSRTAWLDDAWLRQRTRPYMMQNLYSSMCTTRNPSPQGHASPQTPPIINNHYCDWLNIHQVSVTLSVLFCVTGNMLYFIWNQGN